ncbi:M56 family metallopeptidase [Neotamlana sedimentorum]|uniref:M56 family metallopeptidase n=1 Tax=Neotamlana sedimentorum TaxID=1435349 RepID=UPI000AD07932|nr:M56 family metallopeptidase [Tamlana sedimentorum]
MVYYLLQTITFQLCFLLVYDVFLKRETFFNWNRAYLLFTTLLSVFLPFIKIESFKKAVPEQFVVALPEVFLGQTNKIIQLDPVIIKGETTEVISLFSWQNLFYLGMLVALILFVFKLYKVIFLIKSNPQTKYGKLSLVSLFNSTNAFSFFNYVFLGEQLSQKEKASILRHEMVHVNQKHTLDLLFFELLRIVFWFNPLVYIYQNKLITLHEFIADSQAVKHQGKKDYYQNLLAQVFQTKRISFINPFYKQSLIKKRIVMLQKSKSKQVHLFKYALLIPVVLTMLIYSACTVQNELIDQNLELSSYTYEIKMGESPTGENAIKYEKYEAFLKANSNYVGWAELNRETKVATYSVHHKDEKVPEGFGEWTFNFEDGRSYIVFMQGADKGGEINMSELSKQDYLNALDVPFSVIDEVPVFPGCEYLSTNQEKRECVSKNISIYVNKNFNTKIADSLQLKGRQRINVIFKIDTEGHVTDVRSRAPHPALEEEAIRVISSLPKMIPGVHQGKKVNVPYSLPIVFQLANVEVDTVDDKLNDIVSEDIEVPFSVVENAPVFPGCETLQTNEERKKCMSKKISEFVAQKFNTDLGNQLGLTGRQRLNVIFKIDEFGSVTTDDIRARAPHKVLEEEAIRVISELPKMTPGTQKEKTVKVPYSLPIIFTVDKAKKDD